MRRMEERRIDWNVVVDFIVMIIRILGTVPEYAINMAVSTFGVTESEIIREMKRRGKL